jgi:hypothetical protein
MTEREAKAVASRFAKSIFPDAVAVEHFGGQMEMPPHFKWPPGWKVEFSHGKERRTIWEWQHASDLSKRLEIPINRPNERKKRDD